MDSGPRSRCSLARNDSGVSQRSAARFGEGAGDTLSRFPCPSGEGEWSAGRRQGAALRRPCGAGPCDRAPCYAPHEQACETCPGARVLRWRACEALPSGRCASRRSTPQASVRSLRRQQRTALSAARSLPALRSRHDSDRRALGWTAGQCKGGYSAAGITFFEELSPHGPRVPATCRCRCVTLRASSDTPRSPSGRPRSGRSRIRVRHCRCRWHSPDRP